MLSSPLGEISYSNRFFSSKEDLLLTCSFANLPPCCYPSWPFINEVFSLFLWLFSILLPLSSFPNPFLAWLWLPRIEEGDRGAWRWGARSGYPSLLHSLASAGGNTGMRNLLRNASLSGQSDRESLHGFTSQNKAAKPPDLIPNKIK